MHNPDIPDRSEIVLRCGLPAEVVKFPDRLALGNIVKLNRLYEKIGPKEGYQFGIIAEQIGTNAFGRFMVSLFLYDEKGHLYMGPNQIPNFVDFCESEFTLYKVATEMGYTPVDQPPSPH